MLVVFMFCNLIGISSALVNPILYCYRNELMRNDITLIFKTVLRKIPILGYLSYYDGNRSRDPSERDATVCVGGREVGGGGSRTNGMELGTVRTIVTETQQHRQGDKEAVETTNLERDLQVEVRRASSKRGEKRDKSVLWGYFFFRTKATT